MTGRDPEIAARSLSDGRDPAAVVDSTLHDDAAAESPAPQRDAPISFRARLRQPRTLLSFVVSAVIIVFVVTRLHINIGEVWRNVRSANPLLLLLAFVVYYTSFPVRALRWRVILANAGYDRARGVSLPSTFGLIEILFLSWFANTLLPAKLGDVYRSYLFKKATGVSFTKSVGIILAERFIDIIALFSFLVISSLIVFGHRVPTVAITLFLFGGALSIGGLVGLLVFRRAGGLLERIVPAKVATQYRRLEEGIFGAFGRWPALVSLTTVIWLLEGVRVFCVTQALGVHVSFAVAAFVALAASLLTAVPFTPAGLGAVETGIVGILQFVSVDRNAAASVAIVDRVIGYWSILFIGGIVYLVSKRK